MGDRHSAKRYYIHGFLEWVTVTVPSDIIHGFLEWVTVKVPSDITYTVSLNG